MVQRNMLFVKGHVILLNPVLSVSLSVCSPETTDSRKRFLWSSGTYPSSFKSKTQPCDEGRGVEGVDF